MKCARELMNVAEAAKTAQTNRIARIIANSKKNAARYVEEEIAPTLERKAKDGDVLSTTDVLGFTSLYVDNIALVAPIYRTKDQYAPSCRKTSYAPDENKAFLLSHLKEYLEQFCFSVTKSSFRDGFYTYGEGWQEGVRIYINANPEC